MTIKVVNIKSKDKYDVYIGRRIKYQPKYVQSKWHNPYVIGRDGSREEVITKFEKYLLGNTELMSTVSELKDKVLGCW